MEEEEEGEGDYDDSVMEVQPDIIVGGEEDNNPNQVGIMLFFKLLKYKIQLKKPKS